MTMLAFQISDGLMDFRSGPRTMAVVVVVSMRQDLVGRVQLGDQARPLARRS